MSERKPHLWCLFRKLDGRIIEGLLFDEARAFISNLDTSQLENWFAWKDECPDWRPVNQVDGLTEMIYRVPSVSPPPPPKGTEESSLAPLDEPQFRQTATNEAIAVLTSDFVVRNKKRYKKRMQITILSGSRIFRTFTKDISVGGMNLDENVPEWVAGHFKVRIAKPNSKQQIELMCCLIADQPMNERHRLCILPLQSINDEKNLEMWIAA